MTWTCTYSRAMCTLAAIMWHGYGVIRNVDGAIEVVELQVNVKILK